MHMAPGEAEAECALLQMNGIVDAVLSEDVDTLMFGSGITLRNWTPEMKSSKTPTHVNLYDAEKTKTGPSKLDREGMILIALMSGGDYVPEGIPGCGPKTACEAARAGFGRDLCRIPRSNKAALQEWRAKLVHELHTNESKYFKRKHSALSIPEDFPRADILKYYTHPVVSSSEGLNRLKQSLKWDADIDYAALRGFTADAFDWVKLGGAKKFIRNLAPAILARDLRLRGQKDNSSLDEETIEKEESNFIKSIHGSRRHVTTDLEPELRVAFTPIDVIKIDLDLEEPDDVEVEQQSDPEEDEGFPSTQTVEPRKSKAPLHYEPTQLEKIWMFETFVKVGVPLKVQDWEEKQRGVATKKATKVANTASRKARSTPNISSQTATIHQFGKITKPNLRQPTAKQASKAIEVVSLISEDRIPASSALPVKPTAKTSESSIISRRSMRRAQSAIEEVSLVPSRSKLARSESARVAAAVHSTKAGCNEGVNLAITNQIGIAEMFGVSPSSASVQSRSSTDARNSNHVSVLRQSPKPPVTPRKDRQLTIPAFMSPSPRKVGSPMWVPSPPKSLDKQLRNDTQETQDQQLEATPRHVKQKEAIIISSSPQSCLRLNNAFDIISASQRSLASLSPTRSPNCRNKTSTISVTSQALHDRKAECHTAILISSSPAGSHVGTASPVVTPHDLNNDLNNDHNFEKLDLRAPIMRALPSSSSALNRTPSGDKGVTKKPNQKRRLSPNEKRLVRLRESLNGWFAIETEEEDGLRRQGVRVHDVGSIDLTGRK